MNYEKIYLVEAACENTEESRNVYFRLAFRKQSEAREEYREQVRAAQREIRENFDETEFSERENAAFTSFEAESYGGEYIYSVDIREIKLVY